MNKKVMSLSVLFVLATVIPALTWGMEKNENVPPKMTAQERLLKIQEENKKNYGGNQDEQKIEKQDETEEICAICQNTLSNAPSLVLHEASGHKKKVTIAHAFHAHCLWNWYNTTNHAIPAENIENNIKSRKRIKISCPLCGNQEFEVSIGELCSKYAEYLKNLTLAEKFSQLKHLPKATVLEVIKQLATLTPSERDEICGDKKKSNLKIQKIVFKRFMANGYEEQVNQNTNDNNQVNEAIDATIKIIGDDEMCPDFLTEIIPHLPEEEFIKHFKSSFETTGFITSPEDNYDDYHPTLDNNANEDDENVRSAISHYAAIAELYNLCSSHLPLLVRNEYYLKILNTPTPSSEQQSEFIDTAFPDLSKGSQLIYFDMAYPKLSALGKTTTLIRLKEELLKSKDKDAINKMIYALSTDMSSKDPDPISTYKLLNTYFNELSPANRFVLFCRIFNPYYTGNNYDNVRIACIKNICGQLEKQECESYLKKVVQFLTTNQINGSLFLKIFTTLNTSTNEKEVDASYHFYDQMLQAPNLNNRDTYCNLIFNATSPQLTTAEKLAPILILTLSCVNSLSLKNNLLNIGLKRLPKDAHLPLLTSYLHICNISDELATLIKKIIDFPNNSTNSEKKETITNLWFKLPKKNLLQSLNALLYLTNIDKEICEAIKLPEWLDQYSFDEKNVVLGTAWAYQPQENSKAISTIIFDSFTKEELAQSIKNAKSSSINTLKK